MDDGLYGRRSPSAGCALREGDYRNADLKRLSNAVTFISCVMRWTILRDFSAWIVKWQGRYPKLVDWAGNNIVETLTSYRLPRTHHKQMKSNNMLERINREIKRRTRVVRIFPSIASCLRLIRALCIEPHETWLKNNRYLNMTLLGEQKKELLRLAA